ncbi:MAG: beta-propeller fold lactonase family protein [Myxococcales bacterium]|nr:beta-propeller fold lactonase family protein [Myxococcales bacterium]
MDGRKLMGLATMLAVLGCGNDDGPLRVDAGDEVDAGDVRDDGGAVDGGELDGGGVVAVSRRASRSSAVAISDDDTIVGVVNPEDGTVAFFDASTGARRALLDTGERPSSIVFHPNGTTAFVANRGEATVVRIDGLDGTPTVTQTVDVGAEPTGLALSPTGATLFVAEHAEGSIGVIDVARFGRTTSIDSPHNPFALAITNDGDDDDDDELLFAPEFFGTPIPGAEGADASRRGLVRVYRLSDLAPDGPITFEPIESGFSATEGGPSVMTSPNQLGGLAIAGGRLYVTSISVSAAAPVRFDLNVQPVIYVADIATRTEVRDGAGSTNLARLVRDAEGDRKLFLADTVDLSFIGDSLIAYAVSRGADAVQRVVFDPDAGTVTIGSARNLQIDVLPAPDGSSAGCQTPIGITTSHDAPRAFLNCWANRRLGVVDLSTQALSITSESEATSVAQREVDRGRRFFFTGRARWSNNGWSSCGSCHPGGLSDNVTWSFAAGPRQSTSLDGSYSHGPGTQKQRIFNWTGIFDEMHDFERNTRDVSGGRGAVTTGDCSSLAAETQVDMPGNLAQPVKELADAAGSCVPGEWDAIDAYVRTVLPPQGRRFLDPEAVARGAALFGMPSGSANNGGCVACHGGQGWTVSRRFFVPSSATNAGLAAQAFARPAAWAPSWNQHTLQIAPQPASADSGGVAQGPPQVACVQRDVETFGVPGDATATAALEVRANGTRAQGEGGFNVPSLYGLSLGAPYLHHGQAATLEELLTDPRWEDHLRAANPVFLTTGDVARQRADLLAFLLSIDATTPEQPIPTGFDGCPVP